ncbi:MFS transporter [Sinomonas cellulolyticus]|uniref:MFS transporter n=1 Tax=Sinomonas cellulolyticus TaxID=2801916 RepID=A0ABS1K3B0_9MICC|nr:MULTISPECIES: MFS transporter [Sinomonas]MBL0704786.1 MFS transporter [Sinomonas cellulolyticus]GHG47046.1 MFS transporter [Sinomonas sp. KCTC 49339]
MTTPRASEVSVRPLVRTRSFVAFWTGQGISQLGVQLGQLALPVLAVSLLGAGEMDLGVLNAASMAAFLIVGLPAGAWVDRWLKRGTMIRADLVRMTAMSAVPLLWWAGALQMWHLYVVAAVVGVATVFFDVAYQSYIPLLVQRAQVADANGKLEATAQVARMGGPALGGFLLTLVSAPVLFAAEAGGYLASALCLGRVRDSEKRPERTAGSSLWAEIREGAVFVARHPLIRRVVACTALSNLFSSVLWVLMPLVILRELALGPVGLGVMMSIGAIGGLLGAPAGPRLARFVGEGPLLPLGLLLAGAGMLLFPAALAVGGGPLALVLLSIGEFGVSFGVLVYNVMQVSMRQRVCPPRLLGRMNASIRCVVWGVMPIGSLLGGVLGEQLGVAPALWISVVGTLLGVVPVAIGPFFRMRMLPDAEAE